ncbi:transglycosylase domain-containing protein [Dysgonomonas sp. BGC7]|uniref:transglycosylase domain-containing protein n=1 Tax=Dysgonomonas sp. BGC7 TaxID=1658008 RepID=UPI000680A973|nr:transglycosylase domain-containing protein [Dysgonomonas sp. BGC7]MBD8387642.1 transglycosylase domain-containing protein [Dysgonomonas sp. BGC7]
MKKPFEKKYLIFFAIFSIAILFGYIYFTKSAYWRISVKDREEIISTIKSSQGLPERFYELYNIIHPQSLNKGQFYYLVKQMDTDSECPCRLAGYNMSLIYNIHLISFTFWLENEVSQKECLNYYASQTYMLYNLVGVFQASEYYFEKEINNLTDTEYIELILIMENPSFYNKKRNTSELKSKTDAIINEMNLMRIKHRNY